MSQNKPSWVRGLSTHRLWVQSLPLNISGPLQGQNITLPTPPSLNGDITVVVDEIYHLYSDNVETWWMCTVTSATRTYVDTKGTVPIGSKIKFLERELRAGTLN